ncbi:hypothetical protein JRT64AECX_JRT64AEC_02444 [Escherichia coli]|nr:hypothetical protein JRT64AECX_JRT64AEC_02444 [Escherichia coli]
MKYPTGVENHGGKLRIWFVYKGVRVRENLGVPDTAKNRRVAGELRASVCYAIKTGVFDYAKQFPSSRNLEKFGEARQDLTIKELAESKRKLTAVCSHQTRIGNLDAHLI